MSHKIIFLGSGEFAVPSLRALASFADFEIQLVVTQPDKARGRGQKIQPGILKAAAEELGLKVAQPEKKHKLDLQVALAKVAAESGRPEALVVVSYGKILPQDVLDLAVKGCLNLHPSLLPKYRGSAPIQGAILDGLETTGVTIMLLDAEMDHGPILDQKEVKIEDKETGGGLSRKLAEKGAEALVEALEGWLAGQIEPREQNHDQATYTSKITKEMGKIDWERSAAEIERQVRALQPWPGAFTVWEGKILKIWRAEVTDGKIGAGGEVGMVLGDDGDLRVVCGVGVLHILELQLEGRWIMSAREFLTGNKGIIGEKLG